VNFYVDGHVREPMTDVATITHRHLPTANSPTL
jgi:hypothetical protein